MISSINAVISNYDEAKHSTNKRKVLSGIEEDDIGLSIDSINEEDAFDQKIGQIQQMQGNKQIKPK